MTNIVHVTESNFNYEVIAYSSQIPVVVDFWAAWSVHSKVISPLLETLVDQNSDALRLAKVDADANPKLTRQYNIRTLPAIKAFKDGQVIAELNGPQPESKVREFILALLPADYELALEKGLSLLGMMQWGAAEDSFREYLTSRPDHPPALLGLARSLAGQGYFEEAQSILARFPASKEFPSAEILLQFVKAMLWSRSRSASETDPILAGYLNALRLAGRGNFAAALDGLLDVLRQNKRYRDGETRRVVLGLLELLGPANPLTGQYRSELAMVLF